MNRRVHNFEVGEPIDAGGGTIVHRAVQHMGRGVTRDAAIKFLQIKDFGTEEQVQALTREVSLLVEVSTCPHIVTLYDFDLDAEGGAWIAMELGGPSLKHFLGEKPADPLQVRVLLRDCLRGLQVCHSCTPPILHRDIKPSNILSTGFGTWMISDFGLAKRAESDDTLNVVTVQYAAPEMLDATLGPESPRMDLYSLGMVAYEFALGRELHRQQFPSVYDPYAGAEGTSVDLRPKWMYWHTSMDMTLPPLAELLPDFPQDLSDLIASMTRKPHKDRIAAADEALALLGNVTAEASLTTTLEEEPEENKRPGKLRPVLLAVGAVVLIAALGAFVYRQFVLRPAVLLDGGGKFSTQSPTARVAGTIEHFPRGGSITVSLRGGSPFPVTEADGHFVGEVPVGRLGEFDGVIAVANRLGIEVARKILQVERLPPETVQLYLWTRPKAAGADVTIRTYGASTEPREGTTDENGELRMELPYGAFDVEISHACFGKFGPVSSHSGIEPVKEVGAPLEQLSHRSVEEKIQALLAEKKELAAAAARGDEAAVARFKGIMGELKQLSHCGRQATGELADREKKVFEDIEHICMRVLAGDAQAIEDIQNVETELGNISEELKEINEEKRGAQFGAGGSARVAAGGAPASSPEDRKAKLLADAADLDRRMAELCPRAAAGDLQAAAELARLAEERKKLQEQIGGDDPFSRAVLEKLAALQRVAAAAASGDPDAIAGIEDACRGYKLSNIVARTAGNPEDFVKEILQAGGGERLLGVIDQTVLLQLDPATFKAFILMNIPSGALKAEDVEHLRRLRIQGPVFDDREHDLLMARLEPALPRLQLEIRVDAWAVCLGLERALAEHGVKDPQAHAYLAPGDHRIFILYDDAEGPDTREVFEIARHHVVDPDLLLIRGAADASGPTGGSDEAPSVN